MYEGSTSMEYGVRAWKTMKKGNKSGKCYVVIEVWKRTKLRGGVYQNEGVHVGMVWRLNSMPMYYQPSKRF